MNDCACFQYVGDNPHCPKHWKSSKRTTNKKKRGYRKQSETSRQRRLARGEGSLPKMTKVEQDARIEMVVRKARAIDQQSAIGTAIGVDVIRSNRSPWFSKARKVG